MSTAKRGPLRDEDCYWDYGKARCGLAEYCEYRLYLFPKKKKKNKYYIEFEFFFLVLFFLLDGDAGIFLGMFT